MSFDRILSNLMLFAQIVIINCMPPSCLLISFILLLLKFIIRHMQIVLLQDEGVSLNVGQVVVIDLHLWVLLFLQVTVMIAVVLLLAWGCYHCLLSLTLQRRFCCLTVIVIVIVVISNSVCIVVGVLDYIIGWTLLMS